MRSVRVSNRGLSRIFNFSCLVSVSAMLTACSVDSDRLSFYTDSTGDTVQPIVDPREPQHGAAPSWGGNYDRSVSSSSINAPVMAASLPKGSVADAHGNVAVARGDTLYAIARANNVHVKDLIEVNNLQAPYRLNIGQQIQLPRGAFGRTQVVSSPANSQQPAYAAPGLPVASSGTHQVKAGETLYSLGRMYDVHPNQIARSNDLPPLSGLRIGQMLRIPSGPDVGRFPAIAAKTSAQPGSSQKMTRTYVPVPSSRPGSIESAKPSPGTKNNKMALDNTPLPQPEKRGNSKFRWPLTGRVISSYGPKPSGSRNDGINIAVPEGTSVKAAENGVVAYAGNELKGYGNLILIRHDSGWVTAYAHNKELFVKRGDQVSRGRVIAKSGSTGSVTSPQLHFEIRKGADAVDPIKYLGSSKLARN